MAENDRTRGYRDNETYRRPRPQASEASGDPLAELARLIGQQNESTPSHRQNAGSAYGSQPVSEPAWSAPVPHAPKNGAGQGASHWPSSYAAEPAAPAYGGDHYDPRYGASAPQTDAGYHGYSPSYADQRQAATPYAEGQYSDQRYGDQNDYAADQRYDDSGYADPRYADPRYADSQYGVPGYENGAAQGYTDQRYADPRYAEPNFGTQAYGAQAYGAQSYETQGYASGADGYAQQPEAQGYSAYGYQDGGQPQGQGYGNPYLGAPPPLPSAMVRAAEDHAPAKRRGSIVTVLAVLALAVVGTGAAFGYRALFVGTSAAVPPPVIKADPRPSKVVPVTDPNNKPIQDRIGVKTEKVVPRQEEPVQQAAPGQPRVISPWLAGQNPQAFPPASANIAPGGSAAPQSSAAQQGTAEPKRIRTVPIKPQQQGAEAPGPRSSRNTPPAQQEEANAADNAGPMALSPTGSASPNQRQAARQAHAAVTPNDAGTGTGPAASPFPTPLPASTAPSAPRGASGAASGPFAVQVTSQRSEADAQASFRSLQQQFPAVLGSRQPVIRRADLGERGTYYRAQIPFASQNEATEFCSSLKSAGGQCVVAKN